MRLFLTVLFLLWSVNSFSQNGYAKLLNDSILVGYLKHYTPVSGARGIEVWKDKKDKHPAKLLLTEISEYAVNKDTFKIFREFLPFQESDVYIELAQAKIISRGKIILYQITEFKNPNRTDPKTGAPIILDDNFKEYYFFVLEEKATGHKRAISTNKEKMREVLLDFFPERYLIKYAEVNGKIKYKTIPDVVKLYNSK